MPLDKSGSKKAFGHNVSAEMHAGKPQKQALAIAYATARKKKGGNDPPDEEAGETSPDNEQAEKKPTYNTKGKRGKMWWM